MHRPATGIKPANLHPLLSRLRARQPGREPRERRQALCPQAARCKPPARHPRTQNFDTTWLDVTGQSHVREIDFEYPVEIVLKQQTPRQRGRTPLLVVMWDTNPAAPLHANCSLDNAHQLPQRHTFAATVHHGSSVCARPPPRSNVAGRLSRKRNRKPRRASRALQAKGVVGRRQLSCGRRPSRACWAGKLQVPSDSGRHCWCESCLRHAHLSSISNAPSKLLMEPQRLTLHFIKCIVYVRLPADRHAIRIILPNPSLARALLVPKTSVHLHECPGRRHTWVALAFASRVALELSEICLATIDSIGHVSELRLLLRCPRKHWFILRRNRQQPSGRQHLRTIHQRVFMVLSAAKLPCCSSAIVDVQSQSRRSWTVSTNWHRLKTTCIKSHRFDATVSEGPSKLSSISPRATDDRYSFTARSTLRHMTWHDTRPAAMTHDLNSSASTITLSSKDATQTSSSDATFQISSYRRADRSTKIAKRCRSPCTHELAQESCKTTQMIWERPDFGAKSSRPPSAATTTACEAGLRVTQRLSDNFVKRQAVLKVSTMSAQTSPLSWHVEETRGTLLTPQKAPTTGPWTFECLARNPLPEVLVYAGHTVAERLDCDTCIAEQARVSELEEQRPTECVVHFMRGATGEDDDFGHAEGVCGQAWRQTAMARRVGSTHLPPNALQS